MNTYIYQADIYCEQCGEAIRARLDAENEYNRADYERDHGQPYDPPNADTPETEYDSDEYPKGPNSDGGGEADSPQHCGCGAECVNALEVDGHKVGAWLENPLTSDGARYVKEAVESGDGVMCKLWAEWYAEEIEYVS